MHMINSFNNLLMRAARNTAHALVFLMGAGFAMGASAQTTTTPPPPAFVLDVTPAVAVTGVERKIVISGIWPDGCPPGSPTIDNRLVDLTRAIALNMLALPTSVPCPRIATPYRYEVSYVPTAAGATEVNVYTTGGRDDRLRISGAIIATTPPITTAPMPASTPVWAPGDVTGVWFDPTTNGSGLTFVHNFKDTNNVFGTWYLYDRSGIPRWYSLQNGEWKSREGVILLEGKIFETRGTACPATTVNACPAISIPPPIEIGTFRAEFVGFSGIAGVTPSATVQAISSTGAVLFSSKISRIAF